MASDMLRVLMMAGISFSVVTTVHGADPAERYLGVHQLGVNRVSFQRRSGRVTVSRRDGTLHIEGEARREPYYLKLAGKIVRIDERELVFEGDIWGIPDMSWADEPARERVETATFTFRVTKGRKFWRLYEVDGQPCVCDAGCGNDFCYVDIDLKVEPARQAAAATVIEKKPPLKSSR